MNWSDFLYYDDYDYFEDREDYEYLRERRHSYDIDADYDYGGTCEPDQLDDFYDGLLDD